MSDFKYIKPNLVLISGKKRNGKDTLGDYLIEKGYTKYNLAKKLKEDSHIFLRYILDIEEDKIDLYDNKEKGLGIILSSGSEITNRIFLQKYGQWIKSLFGLNYWSDVVINQLRLLSNNACIADIRFPYEIENIKNNLSYFYNIITVRINRNIVSDDFDISETSLDDYIFDHTISNDGTLDDLEYKFNCFYDSI